MKNDPVLRYAAAAVCCLVSLLLAATSCHIQMAIYGHNTELIPDRMHLHVCDVRSVYKTGDVL